MSEQPVTIVLLGDPVPWARTGTRGGQRFTPTKQRNNAATLRMAAQQEMLIGLGYTRAPFDKPVSLTILAEFKIPKSWSKKKRLAAYGGEVRHGQKPDWDNIAKQVMDALSGVVYRDDALIDGASVKKRWGEQPKLVITVSPGSS